MQRIGRVIPLNGHGFTIDKAIQFQRCAKPSDLVQNLLHFAIGQRDIIQTVNIPVILKENLLPVLDQLFFGFVPKDFRLPAIFFCE